MHSGERWRLGHRPGLDGLRGVAVLMVMAAHFGIRDLNSGSVGSAGVNVFFTLSGFLITAILLEEHSRTGRLRLGAFYLRRVRRLVPALLACVALAVMLELAITGRIADWDMIVGSLTYTNNFVMADNQWGSPTLLGHTWSLGIEEQFYLAWPIILLALLKLAPLRATVVIGYAAGVAVVLRTLMWDGSEEGRIRLWMGLDTRSDAILVGCLLAFVLHHHARRGPRFLAVCGGLVLVSLAPWELTHDHRTTAVTMPLVAALATAAIIWPNVTRQPGRLLGSLVLRYVGSRSYGLYLYHAPIKTALNLTDHGSMTAHWLIAGPLAFLAAELSWRLLERRFLVRRSGRAEEVRGESGGRDVEGAAAGLSGGHLDVLANRQK